RLTAKAAREDKLIKYWRNSTVALFTSLKCKSNRGLTGVSGERIAISRWAGGDIVRQQRGCLARANFFTLAIKRRCRQYPGIISGDLPAGCLTWSPSWRRHLSAPLSLRDAQVSRPEYYAAC